MAALRAPVLALPAALVAPDEEALLLGGVRLDAVQFFKCSGGGPLVRAESAASVASCTGLPSRPTACRSFSLRQFLDPAALRLLLRGQPRHGPRRRRRKSSSCSPSSYGRAGRPRGTLDGRPEGQVEGLREMHEKSPENVEILLNLAMLLEKPATSRDRVHKAIAKLRPTDEIYYEKILDLAPPIFPS
jgi:hypothetical protein